MVNVVVYSCDNALWHFFQIFVESNQDAKKWAIKFWKISVVYRYQFNFKFYCISNKISLHIKS